VKEIYSRVSVQRMKRSPISMYQVQEQRYEEHPEDLLPSRG